VHKCARKETPSESLYKNGILCSASSYNNSAGMAMPGEKKAPAATTTLRTFTETARWISLVQVILLMAEHIEDALISAYGRTRVHEVLDRLNSHCKRMPIRNSSSDSDAKESPSVDEQ